MYVIVPLTNTREVLVPYVSSTDETGRADNGRTSHNHQADGTYREGAGLEVCRDGGGGEGWWKGRKRGWERGE